MNDASDRAADAGRAALLDEARAILPDIVTIRRRLHRVPEVGLHLPLTQAIVVEELERLGLAPRRGRAVSSVVAVIEGSLPGPTILLRADMDGLPVGEDTGLPFASEHAGVMHACGHDTHVAILMGVAEVLSAMKAELRGTIKFVFQPAEEGPPEGEQGGAEMMVEQGVLTGPNVDAAFALHIDAKQEVNNLYYSRGGAYASADDFRILVKGKQTHGGYPWNGVDPIVTAAHIITATQTIVSRQMRLTENPSVITFGKIAGGVRSNIIPEQVELVGTIRALHPDDRKLLHERLRRTAVNVAESMGATAEVQIPLTTAYPVTFNDGALTTAMIPVLEQVAGAGRVHLLKAETGAEDFSFIAEKVPSFYIALGGRPSNVTFEEAADHHTPDFVIDDSGLDLGVSAMTAMALAYMQSHEKARAAR
jgi:amidohydrolase